MNLKKILDSIKIKADWIGLREVKESTTYRVIRDLNPESNSTSIDHGIMVEVLVNGQFGYCAFSRTSTFHVETPGWTLNLRSRPWSGKGGCLHGHGYCSY